VPTATTAPSATSTPEPTDTPEPTPSATPGTEGRIVYESIGERNDIYIVNPDGSNLSPLANTADMEASPVGSPDGKRIAFVHVPAGEEPYEGMDIWVMDPDGSNVVPVTNVFGGEGAPSWSPDSSQIAFECETWRTDICVINTDGSQSTQLTTDENSIYLMSLVTDLLTARHWSPDGNTIVFMESLDSLWGIARINKDGSGYARLTSDLPSADPTWSPDGTRIAFVRVVSPDCEDDCNLEIYLMNPEGSELTNLTNNPGLDYNPVWSPDGRNLAFVSYRDGNDEVYVLDLESNELTRVTDNPAFDGQPAWSPDGRRLAFTSDRNGNNDIFVVDINGENLMRLTTSETDDYSPYWMPN
jgi:TolB protein